MAMKLIVVLIIVLIIQTAALKLNISAKNQMEDKVFVNWDEINTDFDERFTACISKTNALNANTWTSSMYVQMRIMHEMLDDVFKREFKCMKLKTGVVKLAWFLTKLLKGTVTITPEADVVLTRTFLGAPDKKLRAGTAHPFDHYCSSILQTYENGGKDGWRLDPACYDALITDVNWPNFVWTSKTNMYIVTTTLLADIDAKLDASRRQGVLVKTGLSLIVAGAGVASAAVSPLKAVGFDRMVLATTTLIQSAWDDVSDDEKFINGIISSFYTQFQTIVKVEGSKPTMMSRLKYPFTTRAAELHFKILRLCYLFLIDFSKLKEDVLYIDNHPDNKEWKDIVNVAELEGNYGKRAEGGHKLISLVADLPRLTGKGSSLFIKNELSNANINEFITACSAQTRKWFSNDRFAYKLSSSLVPKIDFEEQPVLKAGVAGIDPLDRLIMK